MNLKTDRLIGMVLSLILVAAIGVAVYVGYNAQPEAAPYLVYGTQDYGSLVKYTALEGECAVPPIVIDTRGNDDPSLQLLPRLQAGDFAKLQAFYKLEIRSEYGCQAAKPGEKYWDLYAIMVRSGPAVLMADVQYEDGSLIRDKGVLAFLHWPGAESIPATVYPAYSTRAAYGFTSNGTIGWGYGGESHCTDTGGPYMIWLSADPSTVVDGVKHSDAAAKICWFDNHVTPDVVFRVARKGGVTPPPTTEGEYRLITFDENGNPLGYLPFILEVAPAGQQRLGLFLDDQEIGYMLWRE